MFERVHLAPQSKQTLSFKLTAAQFQLADPSTGNLYQEPGTFQVELTNNLGETQAVTVVFSGPRVLIEPFPAI